MDNYLHEVFNQDSFDPKFELDLRYARALILIQSPFISSRRVHILSSILSECVERGVRICTFIQEPRGWRNREQECSSQIQQMKQAIQELESLGVHVNLRKRIHEKLAVVDDRICWDGSLNILSHYDTSERMTRWVGQAKVQQVIAQHKLGSCSACSELKTHRRNLTDSELMGHYVAKRRKLLGLSQRALGSQVQVHQKSISDIEIGRRDPKISTLNRIGDCLGMKLVLIPWHCLPAVEQLVDSKFADQPTNPSSVVRGKAD